MMDGALTTRFRCMQPTQASVYAALATRAAALSAQLGHPAAVLIEGHPRADFDGVYRIESEHKGKPVIYNRSTEIFLYHFEAKDAWRLGGKHRPDEDLCVSHIAAGPEGSLPTGTQTWLSSAGVGPAPSPEHTEAVFTVTPLVRELPFAARSGGHFP